jgi:excisionase family DNA binding protein
VSALAEPDRSVLLTPDALAARWQVPKSQVYRLAREGRVPVVCIGRYYRFSLAAIEEWELSNGARGTEERRP